MSAKYLWQWRKTRNYANFVSSSPQKPSSILMKMRPRLKSLIHCTKLVQSFLLLSWRYCCLPSRFSLCFNRCACILKAFHFLCNVCLCIDFWQCTRLVDYYAPLFFTKIASLSPEDFCVSISFCAEAKFIRLPIHEDACTLCHEVVDEIVTNLEDPDMEVFVSYPFFISFFSLNFGAFFACVLVFCDCKEVYFHLNLFYSIPGIYVELICDWFITMDIM